MIKQQEILRMETKYKKRHRKLLSTITTRRRRRSRTVSAIIIK